MPARLRHIPSLGRSSLPGVLALGGAFGRSARRSRIDPFVWGSGGYHASMNRQWNTDPVGTVRVPSPVLHTTTLGTAPPWVVLITIEGTMAAVLGRTALPLASVSVPITIL